MKRYNLYCTKEQTIKAFELGAPIIRRYFASSFHSDLDHWRYHKVTAEQMCGWLREKGVSARASAFSWDNEHHYAPFFQVHEIKSRRELLFGWRKSYEEAILAAIDAALDYLTKNKK